MTINGNWVFLTGAAEGLGNAIARQLAAAGARLALFDVQETKLTALADELTADGADVLVTPVDLADAASTRSAAAAAIERCGTPRALIHNAAVLREVSMLEVTYENWRRELDIIVQGAFLMSHAVWPGMVAARSGSITFVSSGSALGGFVKETAYTPGKHGQEGLMKVLSLEGEQYDIAVNTVTTGAPIDTPMSASHYTEDMKIGMVRPSALAPAFVYLAGLTGSDATGLRFNAYQLSQAMARRREQPGVVVSEPVLYSTPDAPQPAGAYSQAIRAGDFLFVSGQVPRTPDGTYAPASVADETRLTLRNLTAIVAAAGGSLADAVKITAYVADGAYVPEFNAAYAEFFGERPPARTTVTAGLREVKVELDAIVHLRTL